jgi:hypothetical protein
MGVYLSLAQPITLFPGTLNLEWTQREGEKESSRSCFFLMGQTTYPHTPTHPTHIWILQPHNPSLSLNSLRVRTALYNSSGVFFPLAGPAKQWCKSWRTNTSVEKELTLQALAPWSCVALGRCLKRSVLVSSSLTASWSFLECKDQVGKQMSYLTYEKRGLQLSQLLSTLTPEGK